MPARPMFWRPPAVSIFVIALMYIGQFFPSASRAQSFDQAVGEMARRYQACVAMSERRPAAALDVALLWRDQAGGIPARHCQALALVGVEGYAEAAKILELIAADLGLPGSELGGMVKTDLALKAEILGQAGNAWILGGQPEYGYSALSAALASVDEGAPERPLLLRDRAHALNLLGNYQAATEDYQQIIALRPNEVEIYIELAVNYGAIRAFDRARMVLDQALAIDPGYTRAYMERGIVLQAVGDFGGARADWRQVIALRPGTEIAELAQKSIDHLTPVRP